MKIIGHDELGIASSLTADRTCVTRRCLTVTCATIVWDYHAISSIGKRINDMAPLIPCLWEAVDKQNCSFGTETC